MFADEPKECTNYAGSNLILPCGTQYNDRLFPAILEPWNHCSPLIDPTTGKPYPMDMVGDFKAVDLIFKGCYVDSLLNSDADLCWLKQRGIYLPAFQGEIPMPLAPSYWQVREPAATKQSPHRVATSNAPAESPKAKCSNSKSGPQRSLGCSSNTSTPKCPDSTSTARFFLLNYARYFCCFFWLCIICCVVLGNVVRRCVSSLLGSYIHQELF